MESKYSNEDDEDNENDDENENENEYTKVNERNLYEVEEKYNKNILAKTENIAVRVQRIKKIADEMDDLEKRLKERFRFFGKNQESIVSEKFTR